MSQLMPQRKVQKHDQSIMSTSITWIMVCIIVPIFMFAWNYIFMIIEFRWREFIPALAIGPILTFFITINFTYFKVYRHYKKERQFRVSLILAVGMWFACCFSLVESDRTFTEQASQFYGIKDLDIYVNIDPATDSGQSYMDAGQVYFKEGTFVDKSKAVAFSNNGIYCVAPILRAPLENAGGATPAGGNPLVGTPYVVPPSGTIDFWAVGLNCCDGAGKNWKCGAVDGRAGMRMLRDDQKPFYVLAVQEWTAGTGLPVRHPLFFHWVKDPLTDVDGYSTQAGHCVLQDLMIFTMFWIVLVIVLEMALMKLKIP